MLSASVCVSSLTQGWNHYYNNDYIPDTENEIHCSNTRGLINRKNMNVLLLSS